MTKEKEVDHSDRAHASCSASGSKMWLACPGSVYLQTQVPRRESSKYALEGTKAHEYSEVLLDVWNRMRLDGGCDIEEVLKEHKGVVEDEMHDYVSDYVRFIVKLCEDYPPENFEIEARYYFHKELDMFGTADVSYVFVDEENGKRIGVIVDLKYGKGVVVNAKDNSQLAYYACAFDNECGPFDQVSAFIHQPRVEE